MWVGFTKVSSSQGFIQNPYRTHCKAANVFFLWGLLHAADSLTGVQWFILVEYGCKVISF